MLADLRKRETHPLTGRPTKIIDIYCRISKDYDGTMRSVESQEEDCREAVLDREGDSWAIGEVFLDHALSAWDPKVVRPEFDALMARLKSGASDGLIVYDLSRFTRKPMEGEELIQIAERGLVISSIENDYNLMDPDGRKHFRTDMADAAKESDKISQRTTRGKKKKARKGKSNAGPRGFAMPGYEARPEGWRETEQATELPPRVSDEQVQTEREITREVARRLLAKETINRVVLDINDRGILTSKGKTWTSVTMRQMLSRPSLANLAVYKGEIIGIYAEGEPVLDRETWDDLQRLFASRPKGRPAEHYLLGGIIYCGKCGSKLQGRPRYSRKPYDDGEIAREYWCGKRAGWPNCGRLTIDMRFANSVVRDAVLETLSDPEHARQLQAAATETSVERSRLNDKLRDLEDQMMQVAQKAGDRRIEWILTVTEGIEEAMSKVRTQLALLGETEGPVTSAARARQEWEKAEAEGNVGLLRAMVKEAFPRLTILPKDPSLMFQAVYTLDRFDFDGSVLGAL